MKPLWGEESCGPACRGLEEAEYENLYFRPSSVPTWSGSLGKSLNLQGPLSCEVGVHDDIKRQHSRGCPALPRFKSQLTPLCDSCT